MKAILATTALATTLLFGTLGASSSVLAQDAQPTMKECVGDQCPGGAMGGGNQTPSDQAKPKKRLKTQEQNNEMQGGQDYQSGSQTNDQVMPRKKRVQSGQQNNDNGDVNSRKRVSEGKWRFDQNRHQRRNSKNSTFRFYFGGYWYPEPYWEVTSMRPRYRISCGEGRDIVSERFNRVRVVECSGGTYTYLGRRSGDTYRVLVNSRTGRIVGRALI